MSVMTKSEKQFSIFCDQEGHVLSILQDEDQLLPSSIKGNLFFSMVVPGDLDKILNFFLELKEKKSAIGWEINLMTQKGAETFSFFGGIFDDRIGIAAATTQNNAQLLFGSLTKMNNEQANIIRALVKENSKSQISTDELPASYYEELSHLNNDLVNMQRELSKKNQQLDELNKLKNQFLGIAAHDLRNPLGIIMGYSDFLLEDTDGILSAEHRDMMNSILNSSEFMLHLLNDLLDVSVIESGNLKLNRVKTDLTAVVRKSVEMNNVIAQKKNIRIDLSHPEHLPEILIDPGKIEQVLNNLISNAVKFSEPETRVHVTIDGNERDMTVSVSDEGPGIPEAELDKLFKPFERTSVRSTAGEKSTGLGLSITRNLVLGHQGKIWVDSKVGKGSTFHFSLPIAE